MNYLEFFRIRNEIQTIQNEIVLFERESNIELPPLFKTFILNFDIEVKMEDILSENSNEGWDFNSLTEYIIPNHGYNKFR